MVQHILIVRVNNCKSTLLAEKSLDRFVQGEPYSIRPTAWNPSDPMSHYGFLLKNLDEEAYQRALEIEGATLFEVTDSVESVLSIYGLSVVNK